MPDNHPVDERAEPVAGGNSHGQGPGSEQQPDGAPVGRDGVLDPVDFARLMGRARPGSPSSSTRWVAPAIVVVMFVLLVLMGAWLAAHVNTSGTGSRSADAAVGSSALRVG
jgi:hypothetical protein